MSSVKSVKGRSLVIGPSRNFVGPLGVTSLDPQGYAGAWAYVQGTVGVQGGTMYFSDGVIWKDSAGTQGTQGVQGLQGPQGPQGVQGPQGAQGTQAAQGTEGNQGPQGLQGPQGPQSTQGTQGTQGMDGTPGGAQGPQGVQGPQGLQGADGTSIQGTQGPSIQGLQGLQGPQGPQGTQGAQGAQGGQGTQAAQGTQGPQGPQGAQGTSGTGLLSTTNIFTQNNRFPSISIGADDDILLYESATNVFTIRAGSQDKFWSYKTNGDLEALNGGLIANGASIFTSIQCTTLGVGTAPSGTTGEIRATNNITAYYSDDRLKTRSANIPGALEKVLSLNGFYFRANDTAKALGYTDEVQVGVSAQEVESVLPEIVVPAPIDTRYKTVRYEKLIPLLIEAIKELEAKVAKD